MIGPGIPADVAEGGQRVALGRPGEVVAGEENFVAIEKDLMAAGVAWRGDDYELIVEADFIFAGDDVLDAEVRGSVARVHDARAMEVRGEPCVVGDVVAMREEHEIDAAHLLDALHQGRIEARGIDQNIAAALLRPDDEVGPAAVAKSRPLFPETK